MRRNSRDEALNFRMRFKSTQPLPDIERQSPFLCTTLLAQDSSSPMAEIIGLAASIIAIGGAADGAYKIAKNMRRLARDLVGARDDIRRFAIEIEDFSLFIGSAQLSLHNYSQKPQAQTKVLEYMHRHRLLKRIVAASNRVMDSINKVWPRLESLESIVPLFEKFKWARRRTEVEALGPKMEKVKSSLQLVVSVVTLEAVLNQDKSPETKRLV
jgi:hypothetical protein